MLAAAIADADRRRAADLLARGHADAERRGAENRPGTLGPRPALNTAEVRQSRFSWLALPAAALACQSGSSRRVVSCQKTSRGFGLGRGNRWLQVAQPHHLKSTITLDIRNAETLAALAARRAAVSTP